MASRNLVFAPWPCKVPFVLARATFPQREQAKEGGRDRDRGERGWGGQKLTDLAFGHLGWILSRSDRTNEEHRPIPSHMFGTLAPSPESSIPFILFVG